MEREDAHPIIEHMPESQYGFIFHYYRAEVYRETVWRNRLDTTTNWSIGVTGAILSFSFSNEATPHSVILINYFMVWFFLYIESRRFRFYWMLRERTRAIEKFLLSPMFSGKKHTHENWGEKLANSFRSQKVSMSRLESIAWRFRRNYFFLFPLIFISWIAKVSNYPIKALTLFDFFYNARIWVIPGTVVLSVLLSTIVAFVFIAFYFPRKRLHADLP